MTATTADRPMPGPRAEAAVLAAIRRSCAATRPPRFVKPTGAGLARWAAAAVVVLAVGLFGFGGWKSRARAAVGSVVSAGPEATVRRDGVVRRLDAGMDLYDEDRVDVPAGAEALLALADSSRAELGPETTLVLHAPGDGRAMELQAGFLAIDAAARTADDPLTISTPDARAEVVGTRFTLGADSEETHLRVAEGMVHLVRIGDGAAVDVAGGHRAEVADGDRSGLRSRPSLPGTALIIASYAQAPVDFARFNRLVGNRLLGRRLRHLGFRVEAKTHEEVTAADLIGRPLVIVAHSEEGVGFEESLTRVGLKTADVPVLCFEPVAFPTLAMSGPRREEDFAWQAGGTAVAFPEPAHPLSAGLAGIRDDLFDKPGCFGWARPGPGAETIASVAGHASRAVMFSYETGAEMVGAKAPRRRVGLFLDPSQVGEDSEPAWSLVEAAVEWCVEPPPAVAAIGGPR